MPSLSTVQKLTVHAAPRHDTIETGRAVPAAARRAAPRRRVLLTSQDFGGGLCGPIDGDDGLERRVE